MPVGLVTSFDLTIGVKVNMDEAIYMLSAVDSPFITGIASDGLSVLSSLPLDETEADWMHDTILTPRSTLAVNVLSTDTAITLASGDQSKFSTGDLIIIDKAATVGTAREYLRCTGYGSTADTLTVTRAYATAGGSATTYTTGAVVQSLGLTLNEGADPENARSVDRTQASNVSQIFGPTSITMSRTEQLVSKYGVSSEFAHQVFGRMKENTIAREQAYLYGIRINDTSNKRRALGGLDFFITSNRDTTSTQLTELTIQSLLQKCYNNGGVPDRLSANPLALKDLNAVTDSNRVRVEINDPRRGRIATQEVWTEFGPISIVRNRWVRADAQLNEAHAFLFKRESVIRRVMTPLVLERLAKTGDSDKAQIVCEESLEVKGQQHMAAFNILSYGS